MGAMDDGLTTEAGEGRRGSDGRGRASAEGERGMIGWVERRGRDFIAATRRSIQEGSHQIRKRLLQSRGISRASPGSVRNAGYRAEGGSRRPGPQRGGRRRWG